MAHQQSAASESEVADLVVAEQVDAVMAEQEDVVGGGFHQGPVTFLTLHPLPLCLLALDFRSLQFRDPLAQGGQFMEQLLLSLVFISHLMEQLLLSLVFISHHYVALSSMICGCFAVRRFTPTPSLQR
jgi:hypothetical protein